MIQFTIPGDPFAQPRVRATNRGKFAGVYEPKSAKSWKGAAQVHMAAALAAVTGVTDGCCVLDPATGPVCVRIVAYFSLAKSHHRKRTPVPAQWNQGAKDVDNIAKAVLDAGNGILWIDDRQVVTLLVKKITATQGEPGRVEVTVEAARELG